MDIFKAIVLGTVQGVTEWLPISSTAHLEIIPRLLGWPDPGAAASAVMQLGTTLAVLVYFRDDIIRTLRGIWLALRSPDKRSAPDARLGIAVALGTLPILVLAILLKNYITGPWRNLNVVATAMIVGGIALFVTERFALRHAGKLATVPVSADLPTTPGARPLSDVTLRDGIVTGLAQALALVPGMSRSGSTLIGAFLSGLDKPAAVRFSFLLSLPATLLAGLYELKDVIKPEPLAPGAPVPMQWSGLSLGLATLIAFAVGYATIAWLLKYLARHSTLIFVVYRVILGIVLLGLVSQGYLKAL